MSWGERVPCRGPLAAACLIAVAALASSCGSDDDAGDAPAPDRPVLGRGLPDEVRHPAADAIARLQRAFLKRDYRAICASVTDDAARQAGEAGHGTPTKCERDIRRLLGMIRDGGGWKYAGAPRVVDLDVKGRRATATVALDARWKARVALSRDGSGRWLVDGFFGTSPPDAQVVVKRIRTDSFPPAGAARAEIAGADDEPCPPLSTARYPLIGGGCKLDLATRKIPLRILTALGAFDFERCSIAYRVRLGASGQTWAENFDVQGPPESACGDVNACFDDRTGRLIPWRGRIHPNPDGSFLHTTDMCLRTCVGYFIGDLTVRLEQEDGTWRARPVDGSGDSGFRFTADQRVTGEVAMSSVGAAGG